MIECWLDTASVSEITLSDATGFTTNPVLYRNLGDHGDGYLDWQRACVNAAGGRPISLEVQGPDNWRVQAERILELGPNVYVKIPIQSPEGESSAGLIADLERVNATCVFTMDQAVSACMAGAAICSVFAGRIYDTGVDPSGLLLAIEHCQTTQGLWASARQVFDVVQAEEVGADIITLSPTLYAKRHLLGKDVKQHALDTVKEFCQ